MLIYNGERYMEAYSRRQSKRVDERLRKKALAERKIQTHRSCKQCTRNCKQCADGFEMIDTSVFYGN